MRNAEPLLELYDLSVDPEEKHNLIRSQTETAEELRRQYDVWFSMMKQSRYFEPGVIIIDQKKESPCVLCRYQDGSYYQGVSQGWLVKVLRSGLYEVQIERVQKQSVGKLIVNWQGRQNHEYLKAGQSSAEFELPAGTGMLDIWFQVEGEDRVYPANNGTLGDVKLKQLK